MSQAPRRHLRLETIGGVTVVSFVDSKIVTEENIQEVGDQLYSLVEDEGHKQLLLNFGNVQYLSSAALGKLINLKKKVSAVKGKLKLCCIHQDLLEVFRITRLDQVFEIYPEEQTALDKYWGPSRAIIARNPVSSHVRSRSTRTALALVSLNRHASRAGTACRRNLWI